MTTDKPQPGRPTDEQRVEAVGAVLYSQSLDSIDGDWEEIPLDIQKVYMRAAKAALAADPLVPFLEGRIAELEGALEMQATEGAEIVGESRQRIAELEAGLREAHSTIAAARVASMLGHSATLDALLAPKEEGAG